MFMEVTPKYKIDLARELRRRQTESEAYLWDYLRAHRLDGLGFRRQRPIGRFVADFCCEKAKLVVEIDGGYHEVAQQQEFDTEREAHFTGRGYIVVRASAEVVMNDCECVLRRIQAAAHRRLPSPAAGEGPGEGAANEEGNRDS